MNLLDWDHISRTRMMIGIGSNEEWEKDLNLKCMPTHSFGFLLLIQLLVQKSDSRWMRKCHFRQHFFSTHTHALLPCLSFFFTTTFVRFLSFSYRFSIVCTYAWVLKMRRREVNLCLLFSQLKCCIQFSYWRITFRLFSWRFFINVKLFVGERNTNYFLFLDYTFWLIIEVDCPFFILDDNFTVINICSMIICS